MNKPGGVFATLVSAAHPKLKAHQPPQSSDCHTESLQNITFLEMSLKVPYLEYL